MLYIIYYILYLTSCIIYYRSYIIKEFVHELPVCELWWTFEWEEITEVVPISKLAVRVPCWDTFVCGVVFLRDPAPTKWEVKSCKASDRTIKQADGHSPNHCETALSTAMVWWAPPVDKPLIKCTLPYIYIYIHTKLLASRAILFAHMFRLLALFWKHYIYIRSF